MRHQPEQMQRPGLARHGLQHLAAQLLSLDRLACVPVAVGKRNGLVDVHKIGKLIGLASTSFLKKRSKKLLLIQRVRVTCQIK
jgi:hypothetical protein